MKSNRRRSGIVWDGHAGWFQHWWEDRWWVCYLGQVDTCEGFRNWCGKNNMVFTDASRVLSRLLRSNRTAVPGDNSVASSALSESQVMARPATGLEVPAA
jgi:hypothetical protein